MKLLPEPTEHQRRSDLEGLGGRQGLPPIGIEHADLLSEPGAGTDQAVKLSFGLEDIQPTPRGDDALSPVPGKLP